MKNSELKALRQELGLSIEKLAEITGLTYGSVKTMTASSKEAPTWLKTAVWVYEEMKKSHPTTTEICKRLPNGEVRVKYRRPYGSKHAYELMKSVDTMKHEGYFYRHI